MLGNLEGNWIEVKFSDVISSVTNGIGGNQSKDGIGIPVTRIETIADQTINFEKVGFIAEYDVSKIDKYLLNQGDILFSHINSPLHLGKTAIYKENKTLYHGINLLRIVTKANLMVPDFFNYYCKLLRSQSEFSMRAQHAVNQSSLNQKKLGEFNIPLPPLAEQQQIAAKLDELLAQVDNLKTRLDNIPKIIKRFRQSVLAAAVSGKLTEDWRGETTYCDLDGINIPVSWKVKQAQEVCCKVQSGSTPRDNPFDQNGVIPFLKVYNIVNQKIDFNYKPQFITKETHNKGLKRSIAYPNDVLMNIVGPPLGKVALLTDQYPEWNLNQAITFFRADDSQLNFQYLYYVLCEGALVRKVMPDTKGSVGQVNISLSQCREALIILPPIEEQTEIVARVEQLFTYANQIEQRVKDAQSRVNHLTQAILAKAFRGELTAEWRAQNPDLMSGENSAEALLARIKAERETVVKPKKTRKKKA